MFGEIQQPFSFIHILAFQWERSWMRSYSLQHFRRVLQGLLDVQVEHDHQQGQCWPLQLCGDR